MDYYFDTGLTFIFIDYLIERCSNLTGYEIDRSNNPRFALDYDKTVRHLIGTAIPNLHINDIGCMGWPGGVHFDWHQDKYVSKNFRQCAINILMDPVPDTNYCECTNVNPWENKYYISERVPYKVHSLMILNTASWHRAMNYSNVMRKIFTIGFNRSDQTFSHIKQRFLDGKLFNKRFVRPI